MSREAGCRARLFALSLDPRPQFLNPKARQIRLLASPLSDEGFRVKRYLPGADHHSFHSDAGNEVRGTFFFFCSGRRGRGTATATGTGTGRGKEKREGGRLIYNRDFEQGWREQRVLALIVYLNDVEAGGETVFLTQRRSIKPARGRLAIFPTCQNYVHAAASVQGKVAKYDIVNFVTIPHPPINH